MFDEQHFLGGCIGFYAAPTKGNPNGYHVHAEYKYYWYKKSSTPTASIKVGYGGVILIDKEFHQDAFMPYGRYKLELNIGWDWGLKNGNGFSLLSGKTVCFPDKTSFFSPLSGEPCESPDGIPF